MKKTEQFNVSTREAAKKIGLSEPTLYRMRKKGIGPAWARVGVKKVFYSEVSLEAYRRAAIVQPKAKKGK